MTGGEIQPAAPALSSLEGLILWIRDQAVMLDSDLAKLYGVETKRLVAAVKRNRERFPSDFMFQLTQDESRDLRSKISTSSWGGRRYPPFVFTEQGVAMLSSVLRSERAVQVNIEIMRTFVRLRRMVGDHTALAEKIAALERKYDSQFKHVFEAIRQLMAEPQRPRRQIGFLLEK